MSRLSRAVLHGLTALTFAVACLPSKTATARDVPASQPPLPTHAAAPKTTSNLDALAKKYDRSLYAGVKWFHAPNTPLDALGDNNDPFGMRWTKCTNLGLDIMTTLVAEKKGLVPFTEAKTHVGRVLELLERLPLYSGTFPEIIQIDNGGIAEVRAGRIRYSSIDSAWVTLALSLAEARYRGVDAPLAGRLKKLNDQADYTPYVRADNGLMGDGVWVDASTQKRVAEPDFAYDNKNSEARPIVLALLGMNKISASAWEKMSYGWGNQQGLPVAHGFVSNAFVEMTGQMFFDEMVIAPESVGKSHKNYITATVRLADYLKHQVWGYAPACNLQTGYTEYGLDKPDVASPYGAAQLAASRDPRAVANLDVMLAALPQDGRPLPDGVDPKTNRTYCDAARTLDQSLTFLAMNAPTLQRLTRATPWYPSAERRLKQMDRDYKAPPDVPTPPRQTPPIQQEKQGVGPSRALHDRLAKAGDTAKESTVVTLAPSPSGTVAARATLERVLSWVTAAEASPGGTTRVAEQREGARAASVVRAWAQFLPDLAATARKQWRIDDSPLLSDPLTWLELQARAVLSLEKVAKATAAAKERDVATAEVRLARYEAFAWTLESFSALYLAERAVARTTAERDAFAPWVTSAEATAVPLPAVARATLKARLAALQTAVVEAEGALRMAAAKLSARAGHPIGGTSLPVDLDLPAFLAFVDGVASERVPADEDAARARVAAEESLLAVVKSRAPYVPDVQAGVVAVVPLGTDRASAGTGVLVDQVLGELTLAFHLRPSDFALAESRESAALRARLLLEQMQDEKARAYEAARVRLESLTAAFQKERAEGATHRVYTRAAQDFARGTGDATSLAAASAGVETRSELMEATYAEAASTAIALAGARHDGPPAARSSTTSAAVRAAGAEARRAELEAKSYGRSLEAALEVGVLHPFRNVPEGAAQTTGPTTGGVGGTLLPQVSQSTSGLARLSATYRETGRQFTAARAEASLRRAEHETLSRADQEAQALARLELAYSRQSARLARAASELAAERLAELRRMQQRSLLEDEGLVWEAEARASTLAVAAARSDATAREAAVNADRALRRSPGAPPLDEDPEALHALLRRGFYPEHGLVDYRGAGALRVAELAAITEDRRLAAIHRTPSSVNYSLQGTHEFDGAGYSLGFALTFDVDQPRREPRVLEAAEKAGAAHGGRLVLLRKLDDDRRAASEIRLARRAIADAAAAHVERLRAQLKASERELSGDRELHATAGLRLRARMEGALLDARARLLQAEHDFALADLEAVALGAAERPTSAPARPASTLAAAMDGLVTTDPEVVVAREAARYAHASGLRPAVLGGFRLKGPVLSTAYGVATAGDGTRVSVVSGSAGAGVAYDFPTAFAFTATNPERQAVELDVRAAERRARVRAVAELSSLEAARALRLIAEERRKDAQRNVEARASLLHEAGRLAPSLLAEAEAAAVAAEKDSRQATARVAIQEAALAGRGVTLGEGALRELARQTSAAEDRGRSARRGADWTTAPEKRAAEERASAAGSMTFLSLLGLLGPPSALLEARPVGTTTRPAGASDETWDRSVFAMGSVSLPVRLAAIAEAVESSAEARLRSAKADAVERRLRIERATKEAAVRVAVDDVRAAEARRVAAAGVLDAALAAYRSGAQGASLETVSRVEDALLDAERTEALARLTLADASAAGKAATLH